MRKLAVVFLVAVLAPTLTLAWLALRSLRDQEFVLERQRLLLYQGLADTLTKDAQGILAGHQRDFARQVEALLAKSNPREIGMTFDELLFKAWPLAEVGFVVSTDGNLLAPSLFARSEARRFLVDNERFLCNRESVEVYWNSPKGVINLSQLDRSEGIQNLSAKSQTKRIVTPQKQQVAAPQSKELEEVQYSKIMAAEAEFRQLVGSDSEGMVARFLQNKLNLIFWYRSAQDPELVFGAKLRIRELVQSLSGLVQQVEASLRREICIALLNEAAKPIALSHPEADLNWKRPLVATEIGEVLPHWEFAVYLLNPARLSQTAQTVKWTLGMLIGGLLLAIGAGSWLIAADLRRQIKLARQKTDFVSNVSHELKTPLTSIRMFSELLAQSRVKDPEKQQTYLNIITAETARLTRLINNVLDFSRIERGEKKYQFQRCDLAAVVKETIDSYRPQLESAGFVFECHMLEPPIYVHGDRDALAQILVNLLSNAEKYSGPTKHIEVSVLQHPLPLPFVEIQVRDHGLGVPRGSEERIFEQFYRAHDALNSGIQGSGLGLTLARQMARAHGGDIVYDPRQGGGSCFSLRLPLGRSLAENENKNPGR